MGLIPAEPIANRLPSYRTAFAVSYSSGLVAMLVTYVYVAGAQVQEQNPLTRLAFEVFPDGGVAFVVVLGLKALVLIGIYRVVLPLAMQRPEKRFGATADEALVAGWSAALVSGFDAAVNLYATTIHPEPTLSAGVGVFMAAFLLAVFAGVVAVPERDALGTVATVETVDQKLPWDETEVSK